MGNTVAYLEDIPEIVLNNEVQSVAKLLTGCNVNAGTLTEIRRLYDKYSLRRQASAGYFLALSQFKILCRNTPMESLEEQIFKLFAKNKARLLSFLELISALVIFSSTTWRHKIHFAMRIFDFDGNMCLSEDEFTIFIAAFLNGLGYATATQMPRAADLTKVSSFVFNAADRLPDGLITLEE